MANFGDRSASSRDAAPNDRKRHGGDTVPERPIARLPIGSFLRLPAQDSRRKQLTTAQVPLEPTLCWRKVNENKSNVVRACNRRSVVCGRTAEDARGDLSHRTRPAHGVSRSDRKIRRGEPHGGAAATPALCPQRPRQLGPHAQSAGLELAL